MNSHTDAELIELVNSRPELLRWASDRGELNYALVICRECSGRSSLILLPVADVPDHVEWHDGVDKLVERGEAIERGEGFSL